MPTYAYSSATVSQKTTRRLESTFLTGLGLMIAFLVMSFLYRDQMGRVLKAEPRLFPLVLVGLYLFFLVPSRRLLRIQRTSQSSLATTRRGFTYRDFQGEKILSWRDIRQARVVIDADRGRRAYPSRIVLVHSKGRITLENDPPGFELLGARDLVREIRRRVTATTFSFHWFHRICPFCKADLAPRGSACPSCGERVRYVPKLLRPWELVREEGLYLILILLVVNLWPLALLFLFLCMVGPLVFQRRSALQVLELGGEESDASDDPLETPAPAPAAKPSRKKGPVAGILAVAGMLALCASAVAASPGDPPPSPGPARPATSPAPLPSPGSRPTASPPSQGVPRPQDWLPLAVGNHWEYQSNFRRVAMRVTGTDHVNGVPCFVLQSFVGDATESSQVEHLSVTAEGVRVLKRTHKGSDFILATPETILAFPLEIGRRWSWEGDASTGGVVLSFEVRAGGVIEAMGQRFPTLLVVLQGRSADGSELQTKRWYSRGVGMVRELTQMKKGARSLKVDAVLVSRHVQAAPSSP